MNATRTPAVGERITEGTAWLLCDGDLVGTEAGPVLVRAVLDASGDSIDEIVLRIRGGEEVIFLRRPDQGTSFTALP